MPNNLYKLELLEISGFRAFLKPQSFDFKNKPCLAVFAPNGKGKSSIVDALEFMISEQGTLKRLGLRAINNQAGIIALVHNLATEKNINPFVRVVFSHGNEKSEGSREAQGSNRGRPTIADTILTCFNVDPLIRGHELRHFVENESAEDRYKSVANWLQLDPLVAMQRNLRNLRKDTKAAALDEEALKRVNSQIAKRSNNLIKTWEEEAVLTYANKILAPLDDNLSIKSFDRTDSGFVTVQKRAQSEEKQIGIEGLRQVCRSATFVYEEKEGTPNDGSICAAGFLNDFETAVNKKEVADKTEAKERNATANAVFNELWKAAETLFAEEAPILDTCPVCNTPIADSTAGSIDGIRQHITSHLEKLADYAKAKGELEDASKDATTKYTNLIVGLTTLRGLLTDENSDLKKEIDLYKVAAETWEGGEIPDSDRLRELLHELITNINSKIKEIVAKQKGYTYIKALTKLEELIDLKGEYDGAVRLLNKLKILSENLDVQASFISIAIRKKVLALLNTLQEPINDIYRQIQGDNAIPIGLELPSEEDTTQQRLNLVIDFAENRKHVPPSGYLSDSQIHSLALALRLAAIKKFNLTAPIIALDDIVTSYDADHRRKIAKMLAQEFTEFQTIITTHDERFFLYLKELLAPNLWSYKRIIRLDRNYGPRFVDHKVTDTMIEEQWVAEKSAANEMRQAEEEWLLRICRDFVVKVDIRPLEKAYSYDRSELAQALAAFLKRKKLIPPVVAGINNCFLLNIQKGEVENFGSHFQDNPYGDGSIGDEQTRWNEFKFFRDQFVCPKCGRKRFKRPRGMSMAVCAAGICEARFEFKESVSSS